MYQRNPTANSYIQSLCLPANLFFPLLLNLHAISKAAAMTDPTTRTITTATTAPITVPDPLPKGPSSPFAGRTWDDVAVMLLSRMDDITGIGSWFEEDARRDDAALLGETLVTTVIGIAAKEVIGEGEAANVIDRMELLVTSEDARRDNAVLLCETLVATVVGIAATVAIGEGEAANVIDSMELLVTFEDARRDNAVLLCETLVATVVGVELLVTSGTVYGGYRSSKKQK